MINYSIAMRSVNANLFEINQAKSRINAANKAGETPTSEDLALVATEKQNAYAVAQYADVMDIDRFSKHIADHGCVYSRGDIRAILYMMVDCMREQLLEGKKIRLGDLGDFSVSLLSKGAESADKFTSQLITEVKVTWEPGHEFKNLITDAEFNLVPSRIAQAALLKAIKAGETVVDLNKVNNADVDADADNGDGGNGDDNPGGGGSTPGGGSTGGGNTGGGGSGTQGGGSDNTGQGTLYTLNISSADASQGSVDTSVNKQYSAGSRVIIKATPASGFAFDKWSDGSTVNPRNITLNQDTTLTASFKSATVTPPSEDDDDSPFDGGM